jgi:hypothetical protein
MGLLSTIISKVFGSKAATPTPTTPAKPAAAPVEIVAVAEAVAVPVEPIDVTAYLDGLAAASKEKLAWKTSIVDLMKLVGMESSLSDRKELAKELNYTGDTSDSAAMNIWLHKQVLQQIAKHGGKLPPELLD